MVITARHWTTALAAAALAHGSLALALLWRGPESGARAAGRGGVAVSLALAGGAPGSLAAAAGERVQADRAIDETGAATPDHATVHAAERSEADRAKPLDRLVTATPAEAVQTASDISRPPGLAKPAATKASPTAQTPAEEPVNKAILAQAKVAASTRMTAPSAEADVRPVSERTFVPLVSAGEPTDAPVDAATPAWPTVAPPAQAIAPSAEADVKPALRRAVASTIDKNLPAPESADTWMPAASRPSDVSAREPPRPSETATRRPPRDATGLTVEATSAMPLAVPQSARTPDSSPRRAMPHPSPSRTPVKVSTTALAPAKAGSPGNAGIGINTGSGSRSGGGAPGAKIAYVTRIQAWLESHKRYPRRARLLRQEGTVVLHFVMDREGRLEGYRIRRSSGYELLDHAVRAMIERAQPLPKMPASLPQPRLEIVVPVEFILR